MTTQEVNEPVQMLVAFKQTSRGNPLAKPELMIWNGRRYRVTETGLRWPTTKGHRMLHRFTFAVEGTAFELEFDAEDLSWQLLRTSSEV